MYTRKELEHIAQAAELFLTTDLDEDSRRTFESVLRKTKLNLSYAIRSFISEKEFKDMKEVLDMDDETKRLYANTRDDMSQIGLFDSLKKRIGVIQSRFGDMFGQLKARLDEAEREAKKMKERLKAEMIENKEAKSNAEADRKAEVDDRMDAAFMEVNRIEKYVNMLQKRYVSTDATHNDLRQSVSTARASIIKEGYTT